MKITIPTRSWIDKATNLHIVYSKKYDISAYGRTKKQTERMFMITVRGILLYTKPMIKVR